MRYRLTSIYVAWLIATTIFILSGHQVYAQNDANFIIEENSAVPASQQSDRDDIVVPKIKSGSSSQDPDYNTKISDANHTAKTSSQSEIELRSTELVQQCGQYTITAFGNMPANAELSVRRIYNTNELEKFINNEDYTIYAAFDIEILVDGEVWQPVDFDETVKLSISDVTIPEGEKLAAYRIEDEAIEGIEAPDGSITELTATVNDEGAVTVETEHFTTYTFGGVSVEVDGTASYLVNGEEFFNTMVFYLGNDPSDISRIEYTASPSTTIKNLRRYKISTDESAVDIYMCSSAGTIYIYPDGSVDKIYANKDCNSMFYRYNNKLTNCEYIDVSWFDTSLVEDMTYMFRQCWALTSLDLSTWDTSNVKSMAYMFYYASIEELNLGHFESSSLTNLNHSFSGISVSSLDLSSFDTSNVTNMAGTFEGCTSLTTLDISSWEFTGDFTSDSDFSEMFKNCSALQTVYAPKTLFEDIQLPLPSVTGTAWYLDDNDDNVANSKTQYTQLIAPVTEKSHTYVRSDREGFTLPGPTSLIPGFRFNATIKSLANDATINDYSAKDTKVQNITWADEPFTSEINLAASDTNIPIYARKVLSADSTPTEELYIIELYTDANVVFLNSSCDGMFYKFEKLQSLDMLSNKIDTSAVNSMSTMFYYNASLSTIDLSRFDTSAATTFYQMFCGCSGLIALDVSHFNTENTTNMSLMFASCNNLEVIDVSGFKTSQVTSMRQMFSGCKKVQQLAVQNFDTSNLQYAGAMFANCKNITSLDLSKWDTAKLTELVYGGQGTFNGCDSLTSLNLTNWNTTKVTSMASLFAYCENLSQVNISSFDTSNVTDMHYMFRGCSKLTSLDISNFNTSNVTDMSSMFSGCSTLSNLDVSNFNTPNVTDMSNMFYGCSSLTSLNVNSFDTSHVTDMSYMFYNCSSLTTLKAPKTVADQTTDLPLKTGFSWYLDDNEDNVADSKTTYTSLIAPVTNTSHIYVRNDLAGFTVPQITTKLMTGGAINRLLKNAAANGQTYNSSSGSQATDTAGANFLENTITDIKWTGQAFESDINLAKNGQTPVYVRKNGTELELYTEADTVMFDANSATMFAGMAALKRISFLSDKIDTSQTESIGRMFAGVAMVINTKGQYVANYSVAMALEELDLSRFNTSNVTHMQNLFDNCQYLTTIDVSTFNTLKVENMESMFAGCERLQSLDLSNFYTPCVTDMSTMFCNTNALTELDISNFDTSHVTDMRWMFQGIGVTKLDLSHFDTSNVTSMEAMFIYAGNLTSLNLNGWNTSKVTNMKEMFTECTSLTSLDLSSFNTSNVTDMYCMFTRCGFTSLTLGEHFNTSNITDMSRMFYDCQSLTSLDLSSFRTSNVTTMREMFKYCIQLASLTLTNFDTSNVTDMGYMFDSCMSLTNIDVTNFNTGKVTDMTSMFERSGLTTLDLSSFSCNQANLTRMLCNCSITSVRLPATLTHIDEKMFSGTWNCSIIYGADNITSIDDTAWQMDDTELQAWRYVASHQNTCYLPVATAASGLTLNDVIAQDEFENGDYILIDGSALMSGNIWSDPNVYKYVISGTDGIAIIYAISEANYIRTYLDTLEGASKKLLYLDNYQHLTAPCWREYNWDENGVTIMMYEVSMPATFNLSNNTALDIGVTKWLEDAEVNLSIPNKVTLTHPDKPSAYIQYQLIADSTEDTIAFNSTHTPATVEYTAGAWENNKKQCQYSWLYQFDQDLSHASATGVYTGECAITFSR